MRNTRQTRLSSSGSRPWCQGPQFGGIITAVLLVAVLWSCALLPEVRGAASTGEFARAMNRGKAQLENRNSAKAIEAFTSAVNAEPKSAAALRNLARARMLANRNEEALGDLNRARSLEKESAATSYLIGLAHAHVSRFEQAIPFFEEAARLDAFTATVRFQLAIACQLARQRDKALIQLRETVRLDPLHASAHFKLGAYAAQAGDQTESERRQQEFQRLRKIFADDSRTPASLERCLYTLPEPAPAPTPQTEPAIPIRFEDASGVMFADDASRAAAAAVLEVDIQGVSTVFVVENSGAAALLRLDNQGRLARTPLTNNLAPCAPFLQCIAGDFFDDVPKGIQYDPEVHARNDVFLTGGGGVCLLKRTGPATFEDVTAAAGLAGARARRAQWVDYDHDGDLDLLLAADTGLQLWQNNGDSHFSNVTEQAGLVGTTSIFDAVAVDLDANVAVDIVAAQGAQPSLVFMNQRAGRFARMPEPPGPWPPARRVLADDLDNDGYMDALLVSDKEAVVLFGRRSERSRLDLSALQDPAIVLFDFDNDGWLDICAAGATAGRGVTRLWRNSAGHWSDITAATGLTSIALPPLRDALAADLDNDGDTDLLLVTAAGRLRFLRNKGGNGRAQLKLRLLGTKTNPSGIGTLIEARAGEFRAVRAVAALPVEIGLGRAKQLDSVQTVWVNGIVDNQIDVPVSRVPLTILEKNVAAGSCPYLYAWDGRKFRFASDVLGNSPLGLSLRRDTVLPADPDEIVLIGTSTNFRPRHGFYEVEVTEELREVLYLDCARLMAVDHPSGVEIHPTDKLGPPPFPPSGLRVVHSLRTPLRVAGSDGLDRTEAVRAIDGIFAPPGRVLPPPLRGFCEPLTLTMDFGPLTVERPLVLALTGWIQYGDASVNIAVSQNTSLPVISPRLEVETQPEMWTPVEVAVGMPAGKTKTILCDLAGKLPPGARRLRLTTTFELRWDRIALGELGSEDKVERYELPLSAARLYERGYSEIASRAPGHPRTPDFDNVTARPPWRTTPQGWCTRYGDVTDLVQTRDERLVVMNGGDALNLRFDRKRLPPVAKGRERTFFFYSVGWDKDADHNVVQGDTVDPLPVKSGDWTVAFNTRWVRGVIDPIGR